MWHRGRPSWRARIARALPSILPVPGSWAGFTDLTFCLLPGSPCRPSRASWAVLARSLRKHWGNPSQKGSGTLGWRTSATHATVTAFCRWAPGRVNWLRFCPPGLALGVLSHSLLVHPRSSVTSHHPPCVKGRAHLLPLTQAAAPCHTLPCRSYTFACLSESTCWTTTAGISPRARQRRAC